MSQSNKPSKIIRYSWDADWADQIVHNVPVSKVADEISQIKEVYGEVTPQILVDSSKNKKSVFHHYFEWDNEKAANAFRLHRAHQILRHIEITVVKDGEPILLKATEVISSKEEKHNINKGHKKHIQLYSKNEPTPEYISLIKRIAANDINLVIGKLKRIPIQNDIIESLKIVIEELSKESTET